MADVAKTRADVWDIELGGVTKHYGTFSVAGLAGEAMEIRPYNVGEQLIGEKIGKRDVVGSIDLLEASMDDIRAALDVAAASLPLEFGSDRPTRTLQLHDPAEDNEDKDFWFPKVIYGDATWAKNDKGLRVVRIPFKACLDLSADPPYVWCFKADIPA